MRRPAGGRSRNRLEGKLAGTGTRACHSLGRLAGTRRIRLGPHNRTALETAACEQGTGLFTLVGEVAQAEAQRLRREAVRAERDRVVGHAAEHALARDELDEIGTPLGDLRRVGKPPAPSCGQRSWRVPGTRAEQAPPGSDRRGPRTVARGVPGHARGALEPEHGTCPQVARKADRARSGPRRPQDLVGSGPSGHPRVLAPH